jgi:hypothetical protein
MLRTAFLQCLRTQQQNSTWQKSVAAGEEGGRKRGGTIVRCARARPAAAAAARGPVQRGAQHSQPQQWAGPETIRLGPPPSWIGRLPVRLCLLLGSFSGTPAVSVRVRVRGALSMSRSSSSDEDDDDVQGEVGALLMRFKSPLSDSPAQILKARPDAPERPSTDFGGGRRHLKFAGWATWVCDPYAFSTNEMDAAADAAAASAVTGARAATADEYVRWCITGLPPTNDSGKVMVLRSPGNGGSAATTAVSGCKLQCVGVGEPLDGRFTHGNSGRGPRSLLCVVRWLPTNQPDIQIDVPDDAPAVLAPEPEPELVQHAAADAADQPEVEPEPELDPGSDPEPEALAQSERDDGESDVVPELIRGSSLLRRISSKLSHSKSPSDDAARLVQTSTLTVGEFAGETVTTMFHGTDSRAARKIVAGQRFKPSNSGLLGRGVYVTRTRQKAEGYRVHHPMMSLGQQSNAPLASGLPDPGCILQFRVRLGCVKTFTPRNLSELPRSHQRAHEAWHEQEVPQADITPAMRAALAASGGNRVLRYNSAFSPGCSCCKIHGENCPGNPEKDPRINLPPGKEPCDGRCPTGMNTCPVAITSFEEFCVANPDRVDQIQIIDGPAELVGYGKELWGASQEVLSESLSKQLADLETEFADAREKAAVVTRNLYEAVFAAAPALRLAAALLEAQLEPHIARDRRNLADGASSYARFLQAEILRQGGGVELSCTAFEVDDESLCGIYTVFDGDDSLPGSASHITLRRVGARHTLRRVGARHIVLFYAEDLDQFPPRRSWQIWDTSERSSTRWHFGTGVLPRRTEHKSQQRVRLEIDEPLPLDSRPRDWLYRANYQRIKIELSKVSPEIVDSRLTEECVRAAQAVRQQIADFGTEWNPSTGIRVSNFRRKCSHMPNNDSGIRYTQLFNGTYSFVADHQGSVHAQSSLGIHLYYSPRKEAWILSAQLFDDSELLAPDAHACAYVFFHARLLPVNEPLRVWQRDGEGGYALVHEGVQLEFVTQTQVDETRAEQDESLAKVKQSLKRAELDEVGAMTLVLPSDTDWGLHFDRDDRATGIIVASVDLDSPAHICGAKNGDRILLIGEHRITESTTVSDVGRHVMDSRSSDKDVTLYLQREITVSSSSSQLSASARQARRPALVDRQRQQWQRRVPRGSIVWVRNDSCELWHRGRVEAYSQTTGKPLVQPIIGHPKTTDESQVTNSWGQKEATDHSNWEWDQLEQTAPGFTCEALAFTRQLGAVGFKVALAHERYDESQAFLFAFTRFLVLHVLRPVIILAVCFSFAAVDNPVEECDSSNGLEVTMHTGGPVSSDYRWFDSNVRWSISVDGREACAGGPYFEPWKSQTHSLSEDKEPKQPCCLLAGTDFTLRCLNTDGRGWYNASITIGDSVYCQSCAQGCYEQTHVVQAPAKQVVSAWDRAWESGGFALVIHEVLFVISSLWLGGVNPSFFLLNLHTTYGQTTEQLYSPLGDLVHLSGRFFVQMYVGIPQVMVLLVLCISTNESTCQEISITLTAMGLAMLELTQLSTMFFYLSSSSVLVWLISMSVIGPPLVWLVYTVEDEDHGDCYMACGCFVVYLVVVIIWGLFDSSEDDELPEIVCEDSCQCLPTLSVGGNVSTYSYTAVPAANSASQLQPLWMLVVMCVKLVL